MSYDNRWGQVLSDVRSGTIDTSAEDWHAFLMYVLQRKEGQDIALAVIQICPDVLTVRPRDQIQNDQALDEHVASSSLFSTAAKTGHWAVVDDLLHRDLGFDQTVLQTAMLLAAAHGHTAVVQRLVGNDPHLLQACDPQGNSALMLAAGAGHLKTALFLIPLVDHARTNEAGQTALARAINGGSVAMVKALLPGADPHRIHEALFDGLRQAACHHHPAMVKVLLDAGASPFSPRQREDGEDAFDAPETEHHDGDGGANLLEAATTRRIRRSVTTVLHDMARSQVPTGVNPDKTQAIVDLLLTQVNPLQRNESGETPLMLASRTHRVGMVAALLQGLSPDDVVQHRSVAGQSLFAQTVGKLAPIRPNKALTLDLVALASPRDDVHEVVAQRSVHGEWAQLLPKWWVREETLLLQACAQDARQETLDHATAGSQRPRL